MCSHYRAPYDVTRVKLFGISDFDAAWHPETWPQYEAPAIWRADAVEHSRQAFLGQFGLMPHWTHDAGFGKRTYNARSETVAEKASFRDAWRKGQRCIIPAEWFYEPCYETGKAVRWRIARADAAPMGIAGLWSRWWAGNGTEVLSFTMLTVNADADPLMRRFHKPEDEKRTIVVLDEADYDRWLDCPTKDMMAMLKPYPAELLVSDEAPMPPRRQS
jgi:putative SOS response-associated peptidase YedK